MFRSLALFLLLLFAACSSLPKTPYGKAEAIKAQVEPWLFSALVLAAESKAPQAQAAFDATDKALRAWRAADEDGFNAAIPCAVGALEALAQASQSRSLGNVAHALRALSGPKNAAECPASPPDAGRPVIYPLLEDDAGAWRLPKPTSYIVVWLVRSGARA